MPPHEEDPENLDSNELPDASDNGSLKHPIWIEKLVGRFLRQSLYLQDFIKRRGLSYEGGVLFLTILFRCLGQEVHSTEVKMGNEHGFLESLIASVMLIEDGIYELVEDRDEIIYARKKV